ncbi:hypothetical protein [Streptomyces sulphureus]|uniref:hypothetical protein n=1 Tax=Streptomyces sulphureus TaxID=47758 RepID=UPI0003646F2C|nr:hypothetical protein [Streptomyces sulphureus]
MFRRGESVPFAFLADSERFRSNVTPPPKPRRTTGQRIGGALVGLTVVAGIVGSLVLAGPALDTTYEDGGGPAATAEHR